MSSTKMKWRLLTRAEKAIMLVIPVRTIKVRDEPFWGCYQKLSTCFVFRQFNTTHLQHFSSPPAPAEQNLLWVWLSSALACFYYSWNWVKSVFLALSPTFICLSCMTLLRSALTCTQMKREAFMSTLFIYT